MTVLSTQGTGEELEEKLIPAPVPSWRLAGSSGMMLTEAWKPPKPQGWPVGPDSGRRAHHTTPVRCNLVEERLGGSRGTAASPRGTAGLRALSVARTEWSLLGGMRAGWLQELVNLNPPLD